MENLTIETFEQACELEGLNPETCLPDVTNCPEQDREAILAFARMNIIQRAVNGEVIDWNNTDRKKWTAIVDVADEMAPAGARLSLDDCYCVRTNTSLGVRHQFVSEEALRHTFNHFKAEFEKMMLPIAK